MRFSAIVAADDNGIIGHGNDLPWDIPDDRKRFRQLTDGHVVVVGRLTHESIVSRLGRPLPNRITVVVSRRSTPDDNETVIWRNDLAQALAAAQDQAERRGQDEVFVIGGAEIYRQAMPMVDTVHLTRVNGEHEGDTALPDGWLNGFSRQARDEHDGYAFERWAKEAREGREGRGASR